MDGQEQGVSSEESNASSLHMLRLRVAIHLPSIPSSKVPLPQMFPPPPVVPVQPLVGMKSAWELVWC